MVNNINQGPNSQTNIKLESTKQQATEAANKQAQVTTTNTKVATDSVSITPQAQKLKALTDKAEQASGIDEKKVNELKKAIANGEYSIDTVRLAENISKLELKLFGR